ncbi:winged helix-turn-helix domain-containing protein [Acinetobacter baumannii]|uniref:winged helix-turn-helix domain-containing protein n=1 Tax=Acinetobacter baumannii TaxID=470 RepID=UPI000A33F1B7|nr:winged helix-turn-helix domain-containing protein [Acinetobacter baumannii]OTK98291.1 hypothetical protein B9X84_12095 [Acinetobacter baumannii]
MKFTSFKVFAKLNLWWVDAPFFKKVLNNRETGKGIAVLKTAIAIATQSDFHSRESKISYSELENITGLSRPMVSKAIKVLVEESIIELILIDGKEKKRGQANIYRLLDQAPKNLLNDDNDEFPFSKKKVNGWTKIPYKPLLENLKNLPNKGVAGLGALKNYLIILKYRSNHLDFTQVTHDKFIEKCGIQANTVKRSNDILFNHNLISIAKKIQDGHVVASPNMYFIKGLGVGRQGLEQKEIFEDAELQRTLNQHD